MHEVFHADESLHLLHLAFIRHNDHHRGVSFIWQHDDGGVVVSITVDVVECCFRHHVHLNFGCVVNMEVCLVRIVFVEGVLPLSCMTQ